MKAKKPNAELVWKQLDDLLAPRLRLSVIERTVYAHLLRQPSGRQTPPPVFTYGRGTQYPSFRRSSAQGGPPPRRPRRFAHDPTQQNRALVEVRLPDEIPAAGLNRTARRAAAREQSAGTRAPVNLDGVHFMKNKPLRDSIMRASASNTFRVEIQRGVNNWETVARIPVQLESVAQPPAQVNAPA